MRSLAVFLCCCFAAFVADGATVLVENFAYADGPIVGAAGSPWVIHSGTSQDALVVSEKLQVTFSRTEDIDAPLLGQPYTPAGGTVLYASFNLFFTALPTASGTYFAHFNAGSNHRGVVFASTTGAPGGFFRLGIGNDSGATAASGPLTNSFATNQNYFVVTRYNVATGASTIWLNPAAETGGVTASDAVNPVNIGSFSFRQASGVGTIFIDDLKVGTSFADVTSGSVGAPAITTQPMNQTAAVGSSATFEVMATGSAPLAYQWQFNESNLLTETNSTFSIANVASNHAGDYRAIVSNSFGSATSQWATLTVNPAPVPALSVLTYNTHGNMIEDWSTNSLQVRAIGRQMTYLNPDVITFQEIPLTNSFQMTNFVKAFLPGYFLAMNSGTDGFIRSVIASRFPIARSQKWLDGVSLAPFGYTNSNFTRDLFEAQINVPGFALPVHVFTTHLKAGASSSADSAKRAAEASAISNFFVTSFLTTNAARPYLLTGDLNEDIDRPSTGSQQPIQRLANSQTGLRLTKPLNPITTSELTFSIQAASLTRRYDYILPGGSLFTNILSSQVFRTSSLNPTPPGLQSDDDKIASDHLPVMMIFSNPDATPFRISTLNVSNLLVTLNWQSSTGQQFRVEASDTFTNWVPISSTITATGTNTTFATNVSTGAQFFRINRF